MIRLYVNNMHTIISTMLIFNFHDNYSHALLTITSLVENGKLDRNLQKSLSTSSKVNHFQFQNFALSISTFLHSLGYVNWHALQCRIYCIHIISKVLSMYGSFHHYGHYIHRHFFNLRMPPCTGFTRFCCFLLYIICIYIRVLYTVYIYLYIQSHVYI